MRCGFSDPGGGSKARFRSGGSSPDRPHLAEVVAGAVEEPLGAAVLLASQQRPDQTLVLDLAEDRFHHLLSEPVGARPALVNSLRSMRWRMVRWVGIRPLGAGGRLRSRERL